MSAETDRTPTPALRGLGRVYRRGRVWWVEYWHRGQQHRESSRSERRVDAERLLKHRLKKIARGRFVGPAEERLLLAELLDGLAADYAVNRRRSCDTLTYRLAPLRAAFAGERAVDVTEERVERYKAARLAEQMAPATVNRELAALRRAFRLGVRLRRLSERPEITLLVEDNAREGFAEPADFAAVVDRLPAYLQDFARFAFLVGWRKGELQTLEWDAVDRAAGRVTLRRAHSKNGDPRVVPLTPALAAIIERRWAARQLPAPDGTVMLCPLVFHRAGRAVGDFRKAWATACRQANAPALLFHDLRRSAVRNLERAGVSQAVAMKITGHKTASVYRRYRIVDEADMREALTRTEAAVATPQDRKVAMLRPSNESV
jgi:integrase